jgi:heme-degrading monooxygenase HmoA
MFIVIISFPSIKDGKDADFQQWFASSNQTFSNFKGFISRKLLKPSRRCIAVLSTIKQASR